MSTCDYPHCGARVKLSTNYRFMGKRFCSPACRQTFIAQYDGPRLQLVAVTPNPMVNPNYHPPGIWGRSPRAR